MITRIGVASRALGNLARERVAVAWAQLHLSLLRCTGRIPIAFHVSGLWNGRIWAFEGLCTMKLVLVMGRNPVRLSKMVNWAHKLGEK